MQTFRYVGEHPIACKASLSHTLSLRTSFVTLNAQFADWFSEPIYEQVTNKNFNGELTVQLIRHATRDITRAWTSKTRPRCCAGSVHFRCGAVTAFPRETYEQ